jgi:heptosyltransferase-1
LITIEVDTGLNHLSAVLGEPTVEIYFDSPSWKTEAYWSSKLANLGDLRHILQANKYGATGCCISPKQG